MDATIISREKMKPNSAILILHFRDSVHTLPCLDSLDKAGHVTPQGIYVLCVQCQDIKAIKDHPSHPTIIETATNGGFAWANNVMIRAALKDGFNTVVLLNNDTTVDPHFLAPLETMLQNQTIGMVSPKIYFYPDCEFHHGDYQESERGRVIWYMGGVFDWANVFASHWGVDEVDHGQWNTPIDADFTSGCCVALTRKTIETAGLMNEKYFLYFEDADWSLMVKHQGLRLTIEPKSIIYHKNAGSTGGSGSSLQQYYQTRNRFYFGMKYAPWRTKLYLIKNTLTNLSNHDPVLRQAARDALLFRLGIQKVPGKNLPPDQR